MSGASVYAVGFLWISPNMLFGGEKRRVSGYLPPSVSRWINITLLHAPRLARDIVSPYTAVNRRCPKSCATISVQCGVVLVRPQCLAFESRKRAINQAHIVVRTIVEGYSGVEIESDEIIIYCEGKW